MQQQQRQQQSPLTSSPQYQQQQQQQLQQPSIQEIMSSIPTEEKYKIQNIIKQLPEQVILNEKPVNRGDLVRELVLLWNINLHGNVLEFIKLHLGECLKKHAKNNNFN